MTKLLQQAIEQLRELPEEDQDAAADALFAFIASDERQYVLRADQVADVRRTRDRLRSGATRLATADEVAAVKNQSHL
jgi:hypothetical protein